MDKAPPRSCAGHHENEDLCFLLFQTWILIGGGCACTGHDGDDNQPGSAGGGRGSCQEAQKDGQLLPQRSRREVAPRRQGSQVRKRHIFAAKNIFKKIYMNVYDG